MGLRDKQAVFAGMLGKLLCKAEELGRPVFILELYRSIETQKGYVARGVSKTMNSKHLSGLAVDLCFIEDVKDDGKMNFKADEYRELGEFWESLGGRWGGRFGDDKTTEEIEGWDAPHFEYSS
jgi:hypothetical protein